MFAFLHTPMNTLNSYIPTNSQKNCKKISLFSGKYQNLLYFIKITKLNGKFYEFDFTEKFYSQ